LTTFYPPLLCPIWAIFAQNHTTPSIDILVHCYLLPKNGNIRKITQQKNSKLSRKYCPDLKIAQFGQQLLKINSAI